MYEGGEVDVCGCYIVIFVSLLYDLFVLCYFMEFLLLDFLNVLGNLRFLVDF